MSSQNNRRKTTAGKRPTGPVVSIQTNQAKAANSEENEPPRKEVTKKIIAGVLVFAFFALALFLRVYLPYHQVFSDVGIKFTSNDSYFFMRLVDNLIANFPHHMHVDPYLQYPVSSGVQYNFFIWLLTVPAWLFGGAHSQQTLDTIDAYMPAVLGALTVIPVFFIGKELVNRWAGVLAAGLISILPGEFMGRSILGFTDNHVAESLFTAVTVMFLIMGLKTASERKLSFANLRNREWAVIRKPLILSLLAGFSMGIYIFTWLGSLLFVFMAFIFFLVQFTIDHLRRKSSDYLSIVGFVFFGVAWVMSLLIHSSILYSGSLFIAVVAVAALNPISSLMRGRKLNPVLYPLTIAALGLVSIGLIFLVNRSLFDTMVSSFSIFKPTGASLTTIEMQPLISSMYGNPFIIAWGNFNISFFLSFLSILVLIYAIIRGGSTEKNLVVIWSAVILVATLGQRRFGYYLAVNVAVLMGYLSWKMFEWVNKYWLKPDDAAARRAAIRRARQNQGQFPLTVNHFVNIVMVIILFSVVYAPNILFPTPSTSPAVTVASAAPYAPSDAWVTSLEWLKDNSPEPLGDPNVYFQTQSSLKEGQTYQFPPTAYGVLSWWDYGYWITRIAHRIPNANPSQDPVAIKNVADFFTSQNETAAAEFRDKLKADYIVIDHEMALSKFWAIVIWAGKAPFFDTYLVQQQNGSYQQYVLYYPEYYHSMAVRMFNFDGQAVTPTNTYVISYSENTDTKGQSYKLVTGVQQFTTYQDAEDYLASGNLTGNNRIIGTSPLDSPVPLEALQNYKLVHSSDNYTVSLSNGTTIPSVKIFEYVK